MVQTTPSGFQSALTAAASPPPAAPISVMPKPMRDGAVTVGPPVSRQVRTRRCPSSRQAICTMPPGTDRAPYFAAFVPSSCRVSARRSMVSGASSTGGPSRRRRSPSSVPELIWSSINWSSGALAQVASDRIEWARASACRRPPKLVSNSGRLPD